MSRTNEGVNRERMSRNTGAEISNRKGRVILS